MQTLSKGFIYLSLLMILLIAPAACSAIGNENSEEVDWQSAVELLNTGEVTEIMQTHQLEVTLTLADGSRIKNVEPFIDDIFREVERCGNKCSRIVLITE